MMTSASLSFLFLENKRMEGNDHRVSFPPLVIDESLQLIILTRICVGPAGIRRLREKCSEILERRVPRRQGSSSGMAPGVPALTLPLADCPDLRKSRKMYSW